MFIAMSSPEDVASAQVPPLLHLAVSLLIVAVTLVLATLKHNKDKRQTELRQFILKARRERAEKQHVCLEQVMLVDDDDDEFEVLTATETRDLVASGKLDPSVHVVRLARRCREYGRDERKSNAITEELYDEAYRAAKELTSNGKSIKNTSLHGVPISVKDCIGLEGSYSTGGLACRLRSRDAKDSLIVQVLKASGALPLVRGNVPQIMMVPDSVNHIWGRSRNPWDLRRSPGGSSGGDGALVSMGCVPLAVCSDVAGSIRIPAAYCGVTGFKPTSTRLSNKGNMAPRKNNKAGTKVAIPSTVGPIGRTVEDCALFMKAACVPELFDADLNIPRMPFNESAYKSKERLKIGYFFSDGWFEPCSTAKRGLQETIDALTKAGHECVPFEPPTGGWFSYGLLVSINGAEGNFRSYKEALEGETMIPEYNTLVTASDLPSWIRWLARKVIDKRRAHLLSCTRSGGISVWELWQLLADLMEMRSIWSDAYCAAGIDAILHPALPLPAMPHGFSGELTSVFSYTFLANMLLWPAGVVPVTTIRDDEQEYPMQDLPANQQDYLASLAGRVMKDSAGLPLSVAVMTPAFQDEKCLRVMKEVESVIGFSAQPTAYKD